jgi:hypothetical protein
MKAPMVGIPFQLYITAEDAVIGVVLTQIMESKEHIIYILKPVPHLRQNKVFFH